LSSRRWDLGFYKRACLHIRALNLNLLHCYIMRYFLHCSMLQF